MERYRSVTLCADVMHVNSIPMLVTLSRKIKFGTVEALPSRNENHLVKGLVSVAKLYKQRGFQVTVLLIDGEFDTAGVREAVAAEGVALNPTARDEHVGDIERFIRTIKERMRATYNTLPFNEIPARLVIEMAKQSVFWLHAFPRSDGISRDMSPREIITGVRLDFNRHCKFEFGQYVQTHEETDNTMTTRTVGALALRPTGNVQGTWFFLSLSTGRIIKRNTATPLPMPEHVIDRVHRMARQQKADPGLVFSDRNRVVDETHPDMDDAESDDESYDPSEDDDEDDDDDDDNWGEDPAEYGDDVSEEDDDDYDPADDDDSTDDDSLNDADADDDLDMDHDGDREDDDAHGVPRAPGNPGVAAGPHVEPPGTPGVDSDDDDEPLGNPGVPDSVDDVPPGTPGVDDDVDVDDVPPGTPGVDDDEVPGGDSDDDEVPGVDDNVDVGDDAVDVETVDADEEATLEQYMDGRYGPRSGRYSLRDRKKPGESYRHLFDTDAHTFATVGLSGGGESMATAQMSMKRGLAMFGDEGRRGSTQRDASVARPESHPAPGC